MPRDREKEFWELWAAPEIRFQDAAVVFGE
jgi:hypothetical protein